MTVPPLDRQLEHDLSWREAELAVLKKQVIEAQRDSLRHGALLRALWMMLYAHYEGFCKFAFDSYLEAITRRRPKRLAVKDEIAAFSLRKRFKGLGGNLSNEMCTLFLTELSLLLEDEIQFEERVDTRSNLHPNVMREACRILRLPYTKVDENDLRIRTLVSRRNEIAHGKPMTVKSITEYQAYENAALDVMHELAISIIQAIESQSYLK